MRSLRDVRKKTDMKSLVRGAAIVLALVSIGVAAFFGWKIYQTENEYKEGVEAYDLIAEIAVGASKEEPGEIPASFIPETNEEQTGVGTGQSDVSEDKMQNSAEEPDDPDEDAAEETQEVEDADLPQIDFAALHEVNPQIIGWIYSQDTVINYPVVQGDDNDYYLHHLADGTYNSSGCPFLDVKNNAAFSDENSIIYAHHMQNGTMFAGITWYADQTYFEEHPVIYFLTPQMNYRLEPFAGYTTTMDSSAYRLTIPDSHAYAEWLREISGKSDFKASMKLTTHDRIMTLSTCAYSFQDARYVLHCKMTEITR